MQRRPQPSADGTTHAQPHPDLEPNPGAGSKYHRLDVTSQVIRTRFAQYHHGADFQHSIEHGNGTQITPTRRQLSTNRENPVKRPCDNWQCTGRVT